MIQQNIDIVLTQGELYPNTLIRVYRGDSNILLSVKVENQYYKDGSLIKENMIDLGLYGRAILKHSNEENPICYTEIIDVVDGRLPILIPNEAIDELKEVGTYQMQIQMYNVLNGDLTRPRLTLPPFEVEISNLISEDMVLEEPAFPDNNLVGYALAGRAYVLNNEEEDLPVVDDEENYIETEWNTGDTIWANQLNKIEKAISWLFNKIKSFVTRDELNTELESYAKDDDVIEANERIDNLRHTVVDLYNETSERVSANTTNIETIGTLIEDIETQIDDINNAGYLTEVPEEYITEEELEAKNYVDENELNSFGKLYVTKTELEAKDYATETELDTEIRTLKNYVMNNYVTTNTLNNSIRNKANKSDIPTKVSQLSNDAGYITMEDIGDINVDVDLTDYATKEELEIMQTDIEIMIGDIDKILDEINGEDEKELPMIAMYKSSSPDLAPTSIDVEYEMKSKDNGDGIYTISLHSENDFSNISFSNIADVLSVDYLKVTSNVTDATNMFYSCGNLQSIDTTNWDTSKITSMDGMFYGCESLDGLLVSDFNTESVTNMRGVFGGCELLTELDLLQWNVSNVTDMSNAFSYCSNLQSLNISNWDTSNVTNMNEMFKECAGLTSLDVSNWDTSSVYSADFMFENCSSLTSLDTSSWDTHNVTYIEGMFKGCSSLQSINGIENWVIPNINKIDSMFEGCSSLKSIKLPENLNDVSTNRIFYDCSSLSKINLKGCGYCIINNITLNGEIPINEGTDNYIHVNKQESLGANPPEGWSFYYENEEIDSNIMTVFTSTNSHHSFEVGGHAEVFDNGNGTFRIVISDTKGVPEFGTSEGVLDVNYLNINKDVTSLENTFNGCGNLRYVDTSNWDTSNVTNMSHMFNECGELRTLDVSNFNTSNVTNMNYMFRGCSRLMSLDVSKWDVSIVESIESVFEGCTCLTSLDVSDWKPSNSLHYMNRIFENCESLTSLDLSNWVVLNADLNSSFHGCRNLTSLDISNWNLIKQNEANLFNYCDALTELRLDNCNKETIEKIILHDNFPESNKGTIYVRETNVEGLTAPGNWSFAYVNSDDFDELKIDLATLKAKYTIESSTINPKDNLFEFNLGDFDYNLTWNENNDGTTTVVMNSYGDFIDFKLERADILSIEFLDVCNVETMMGSFYDSGLYSVNLSNLTNIREVSGMFANCRNLQSVDLSNLNLLPDYYCYDMFTDCYNLKELRLNNCNRDTIEAIIRQANLPNVDRGYIFVQEANVQGLEPSNGWSFKYVEPSETPILRAKYITTNIDGKYDPEFDEKFKYNTYTSEYEDPEYGYCYLVSVYSDKQFNSFKFDNEFVYEIRYMDVSPEFTTLKSTLNGSVDLRKLYAANWDISNVETMEYMFEGCEKLEELYPPRGINLSLDLSDLRYLSENSLHRINENLADVHEGQTLTLNEEVYLDDLLREEIERKGWTVIIGGSDGGDK